MGSHRSLDCCPFRDSDITAPESLIKTFQACTYTYMHNHTYTYIYTHMHTYMTYIYIWIYVYVCVYIYVHEYRPVRPSARRQCRNPYTDRRHVRGRVFNQGVSTRAKPPPQSGCCPKVHVAKWSIEPGPKWGFYVQSVGSVSTMPMHLSGPCERIPTRLFNGIRFYFLGF